MVARGRVPSQKAPDGVASSPNGLGPERVTQIQRARILTAMVEVVHEGGLSEATVARVVAHAGVSRRTFYEIFDDREQCFLAALDHAIDQANERVLPAYSSGVNWAERIRLALAALLSFLDGEPGVGHLLIVGSLGAGPRALERRSCLLDHVVAIVDGGRGSSKSASQPPPLTAEGIVGGALSIIHARMIVPRLSPAGNSLRGLVNPLMSMIVLPYLGAAASRKELERPMPATCADRQPPRRDPLRDLEMRLTRRTVSVLLAIGEHPGLSNKEVGDASGAHDQGQISKLLARLERLGLIENRGEGLVRGAPNAWVLTARGRQVEQAMSDGTNGQASPRRPAREGHR
jgi:AcrR family transcriptional regulator